MTTTPDLTGLATALEEVWPWLLRASGAAAAHNDEGGDPAAHGDLRLLVRHLANYHLAVSVAERRWPEGGPASIADVGSGTGAYAGWMADRLSAELVLVDHSPQTVAAATSLTGATGATSLEGVGPHPLVTAMEVIEHVEPTAQPAFCASLVAATAPDGIVVVSTPDESLYPGGWSGYAPHVGCVTADQLRTLLQEAGASDVTVWRLNGPAFDTSTGRRWTEAIGNRLVTAARRWLPAVVHAAQRRTGAPLPDAVPAAAHAFTHVDLGPASAGRGGGLVAVARRSPGTG